MASRRAWAFSGQYSISLQLRNSGFRASRYRNGISLSRFRSFTTSPSLSLDPTRTPDKTSGNTYTQPAQNLSQDVTPEEKAHYDRVIAQDKSKQIVTPWHREGSDAPPVSRPREASAVTKGKLLTTPSRMLKLILPLTTRDPNTDRKDVEPLALLIHPQQPLSYLERLIQSELPLLKDKDGKEKIPAVYFKAEDSMQDSLEPKKASEVLGEKKANDSEEGTEEKDDEGPENPDTMIIDGKAVKTGALKSKPSSFLNHENRLRGGPGEGGVESYSGLGHEAKSNNEDEDRSFVRWSSSTEIGDFIRDAARGQEFAVEIEGAPREIRVGVPSFTDRTYYLRMRLRKKSAEIARMADIKRECDDTAENGAKRVAIAGGLCLVAWWVVVYQLTFRTDLGWDVMEPVTYLVGLSTLIGGYGWFLIHNRQVSYRSAMNFTISRRQSKLYEQRGFDIRRWEDLIEEGNKLRREIKAVAQEYDVDWDEKEEEKSDKVMEALKKDRQKQKEGKKGKKDEDEESE